MENNGIWYCNEIPVHCSRIPVKRHKFLYCCSSLFNIKSRTTNSPHSVTHSTKTSVMHEACGNGVYPGMFCCVVKHAVEPPKPAVVDDDDDVFVDESSAPISPATNDTTKGL